MRALAIRVDTVIGEAQAIEEGIRVDVIVRFPALEGSRDGPVRSLVMENVKVLGQQENVRAGVDGHPIRTFVVTVAITPDQTEAFTQAARGQALHITLRPREPS